MQGLGWRCSSSITAVDEQRAGSCSALLGHVAREPVAAVEEADGRAAGYRDLPRARRLLLGGGATGGVPGARGRPGGGGVDAVATADAVSAEVVDGVATGERDGGHPGGGRGGRRAAIGRGRRRAAESGLDGARRRRR